MSNKPSIPLIKPKRSTTELLSYLNTTYRSIHTRYERLYWKSYMGDHSIDDKFAKARVEREGFRTNHKLAEEVRSHQLTAKGSALMKLEQWSLFFSKFQTPNELKPLYLEIVEHEREIKHAQSERSEGYIDPNTKKFIKASRGQMNDIMTTHPDEKMRKACFVALENLAKGHVKELIKLVALRNEYARALGFEDFYAYKVMTEEEMTKKELFSLFDAIYDKTKFAFGNLRALEKKMPGLRKPWNRGYLLHGDTAKESDAYFPFSEALIRWGRSFNELGISFHGGTLQLDLLDRAGKYDNGFCHWPDLVYFNGKKQVPGSANFTCNVSYGQVGSAEDGYNTLFHEGGHAAHLLNTEETEACVNNEYPPASTAWDETQSMFLDSMLSSIEWKTRYASNEAGEPYPFELFERHVNKVRPLSPLSMNGISSVMNFERALYEAKNLTETKVLSLAKTVYRKHTDTAVDSLRLLSIPHIYSWDSSCSYHGYGLAQLAVYQWRDYFYKKYGCIVDNKAVGKEMRAVWKYGSAKPFPECVKLATGKKLSADSYIKHHILDAKTVIRNAKQKIAKLQPIKQSTKPIELHANIKMVHGSEIIASNKKSFEDMAKKYATWLETKRVTNSTTNEKSS